MNRVKWFRDRAERDHLRDEVDICHAEFDRTVISHERMSDVWRQLGSTESCPGAVAYARKKAGMYIDLAETCQAVYTSTKEALKHDEFGLDGVGLDGIAEDRIG